MKSVSELPKRIQIIQPNYELELGVSLPEYVLEVISTRNLKHKMVHGVKAIGNQYGGIVEAPSGYRISRMWRKSVSVENEIAID